VASSECSGPNEREGTPSSPERLGTSCDRACLTAEEIEQRLAAAGAGGANQGAPPPFAAGSSGSAGIDAGEDAADQPLDPSDCPSLPPNTPQYPCVDGIGGPPTHVEWRTTRRHWARRHGNWYARISAKTVAGQGREIARRGSE